MKKLSFKILCLAFINVFQITAQTEILIVGTLHDVPAGMENNYTPILNIVDDWNPDIICTEYMHPQDSISFIKTFGAKHFEEYDSIAMAWGIDLDNAREKVTELYEKLRENEDINERMDLRNLLYLTHDTGNARFQAHKVISLYEILELAEKEEFIESYPMYDDMASYESKYNKDEFTLVEFPLAIKKDIDYLYPTDDQSLRDLYHEAWDKANEELEGSTIQEEFVQFVNSIKEQMGTNMQDGSALITLNNEENQDLLYKIEYSYMPVGLNVQKDLMNYYYMDRNFKMAQRILEIAKSHPNKKIVAFYGASHVPFIKKILRAESEYHILTLPNLTSISN